MSREKLTARFVCVPASTKSISQDGKFCICAKARLSIPRTGGPFRKLWLAGRTQFCDRRPIYGSQSSKPGRLKPALQLISNRFPYYLRCCLAAQVGRQVVRL